MASLVHFMCDELHGMIGAIGVSIALVGIVEYNYNKQKSATLFKVANVFTGVSIIMSTTSVYLRLKGR